MSKSKDVLKHIHRYAFNEEYGTWGCRRDGCSHYMPTNMHPRPLGLMSICWACGLPFKLNEQNMKDTHPICAMCTVAQKWVQ